MILVGLTGGIGAGKSSVSSCWPRKGAVIIDADVIVREVQEPGSPVLAAIVERFGDGVLADDGALDRASAGLDRVQRPRRPQGPERHRAPGRQREILRRAAERATPTMWSCSTCPSWSRAGRYKTGGVVVVDVPVEVAVERLVQFRGMTEADARARIGRQASREERLAAADRVIDNGGDRAALAAQVDELWAWILTLPPSRSADPDARSPIAVAGTRRRRP